MLNRGLLAGATATGEAAGVRPSAAMGLAAGLATAAGDACAMAAGDGLGLAAGLGDGASTEMMTVGVAASGEPPGTGELVTSFVDGMVSGGLLHAAITRLARTSSNERRIKWPPRQDSENCTQVAHA